MDIYDYLKMDHQKVAHLFKLFENSKIEQRKKEIVAFIEKELLVHAYAEQETFYRLLAQYPESKQVALHGEKEHLEIEEQIKRINEDRNNGWEHAVITLKKLVDHHVKEEEGDVFSKAKKVLSQEQAMILKEQMHYLKGDLLMWFAAKERKRRIEV